jgi:hypothetical protein
VNFTPLQAAVNFSSLWHDPQFRLEDPIATALKNNEGGIADAFFFSHHTFTHEVGAGLRLWAGAEAGTETIGVRRRDGDEQGPAGEERRGHSRGWSLPASALPETRRGHQQPPPPGNH